MATRLEDQLTAAERADLQTLTMPAKIQAWLDETPYSTDHFSRCPLRVVRDRRANCFDGALFAAAALRRLGYPPLLVDLLPEPGTDDDHVLVLFRQDGLLGVVAKSNFVTLRYREPVYRSLRELVMSYFEVFYNVDGMKTLRAHTRPLNLAQFDRLGWETRQEGVDAIEARLNVMSQIPIIPPGLGARLLPVDPLSYKAGLLGANTEGLFKTTQAGG